MCSSHLTDIVRVRPFSPALGQAPSSLLAYHYSQPLESHGAKVNTSNSVKHFPKTLEFPLSGKRGRESQVVGRTRIYDILYEIVTE